MTNNITCNIKRVTSSFCECIKISWDASRKYTIIRFIIILFQTILPFVSINLTRLFINKLLEVDIITQELICYVLMFSFIEIVGLFIGHFQNYCIELHDTIISNDVQIKILKKCMELGVEWFDNSEKMDQIHIANSNSKSINSIIWNFYSLVNSITSLVIAAILLMKTDVSFLAIILVSNIPGIVINYKCTKERYFWEINHALLWRVKNLIHKISCEKQASYDIRTFSLTEYLIGKIQNINNRLLISRKGLLGKRFWLLTISDTLPVVGYSVITFTIVKHIVMSVFTIGDYTAIMAIINMVNSKLNQSLSEFSVFYDDTLRISSVRTILSKKTKDASDGVQIDKIKSIQFKDVSFTYPEGKSIILKNISFLINSGDKVCLLGKNGTGKTTILKLLLKFYTVDEGEILLNGININSISTTSLYNQIGAMMQSFLLLPFSIRENISFSKDTSTEDSIISLLSSICADDLLNKTGNDINRTLFKTFDSEGYEPSAGTAQKIALARSLYKDSDLYLFDEPTSAIDSYSENRFLQLLKDKYADKTIIVSTHHLDTIPSFMNIMFIDSYGFLHSGNHEQLLQNPEYRSMFIEE